MSIEGIKEIEDQLLFKVFLRKIGFHTTAEYFNFFGDDLEKRQTAVERYLSTKENTNAS